MKRICLFVLMALALGFSNLYAAKINLGMSMIYFPIAKLNYTHDSNTSMELVDNIFWQPEITYDLGYGFRGGAIASIYNKGFNFNSVTKMNVSILGMGATGNYGYKFTESGRTLLTLGAELGYAKLKEKAYGVSSHRGSTWVAGYVGMRYIMLRRVSFELDYRLSRLEFHIPKSTEWKYKFSGNSLKLTLAYEFAFK